MTVDTRLHEVYLDISIDWLVVGSVLIGVAALVVVAVLAFQVKRRRRS